MAAVLVLLQRSALMRQNAAASLLKLEPAGALACGRSDGEKVLDRLLVASCTSVTSQESKMPPPH